MSMYGWESGTIKLPSRAWAPFKKSLRIAHNTQRDNVLTLATQVQEALAQEFKGKRGVELRDTERFIHQKVSSLCQYRADLEYMVCDVVEASLKPNSVWQTRKITQAMLDAHAGPKATVKTRGYQGEGWSITLNDEQRTVRWHVPENNRAVNHARESLMGSTLLRLLNDIDYGRQKDLGGVIVGNDEYNRDVGDAANYISLHFGQAGELAASRMTTVY